MVFTGITAKSIYNNSPFFAKKNFGQNFLFDEKINNKIVTTAGDLNNKIVMEVGPGPGGLTLEILKYSIKKLYIVEYDLRWVEVWNNLKHLFLDKLEIIYCDALKFNELIISPQIIISNLPYNISTQLLFKWLRNFDRYETLVLMFQKEVADRLYAKPGTKFYGKLSVISQWKSKVRKMFDLEPGSFFPSPKVRSTVVKFQPYIKDELDKDFDLFLKIVGDSFLHKRKIIVKSLRKYIPNIENILNDMGYSKLIRAEELSINDFKKIVQAVVMRRNLL